MRSFNQICCLFFSIIFLTGCSSLNGNFYTQLKRSTPYLKSSSAILTNLILQESTSEEDRKEKAKIILQVASVIEQMTSEGEIDLEVFAAKISGLVPEKSFWDEFVASMILIYADFYSQAQSVADEDERKVILIQALNKIAAGCKIAAKRYY